MHIILYTYYVSFYQLSVFTGTVSLLKATMTETKADLGVAFKS